MNIIRVAEWISDKCNELNPPKKVSFVDAFVLQLIDRPGQPFYAGEALVRGPYIKHSDNYGFVNPQAARSTPHAFSHFTFEASNRKLIVVDVQGVDDFYTDPQVHSRDGNGFGMGNLGLRGIQRFMETHQCNPVCDFLCLPQVTRFVSMKK